MNFTYFFHVPSRQFAIKYMACITFLLDNTDQKFENHWSMPLLFSYKECFHDGLIRTQPGFFIPHLRTFHVTSPSLEDPPYPLPILVHWLTLLVEFSMSFYFRSISQPLQPMVTPFLYFCSSWFQNERVSKETMIRKLREGVFVLNYQGWWHHQQAEEETRRPIRLMRWSW